MLVRWTDAQSHDDWDDLPQADEDIELPVQETVGFLVAESVTMVSVAGSIDATNEHICHRMDIPRGTIVEIRGLRRGVVLNNAFPLPGLRALATQMGKVAKS